MRYRIVVHEAAERELHDLHDRFIRKAGARIADAYLAGLYDFIDGFATFPERGTIREDLIPGLRVIGYRRRVSVAFTVEEDIVLILGVFYGGRNVTASMMEQRL